MTNTLQIDLQRFLFDFIDGVEDLRILEWFQQLGPLVIATEDQIATATELELLPASEALARLVAKGVLVRQAGGGFRYAALGRDFSRTLDVVVKRLEESPLEVLRTMSANSIERLRVVALRITTESARRRKPRGP